MNKESTMTCLELCSIYKDYEGKPLLKGVCLSLEQGETLCLLGSSGSGKSTLLRIIAGLEFADSGQIFWEGKNLSGIPVHKREFGLMFQDYALFPHRNVKDNVIFGLRMQRLSKGEITKRAMEALDQVEMAEFANRNVTDLSGGEQQRVALARALAPRPRLLMLDEPLGALDRTLRDQLTIELHRLLHQTGIPAIYVTHDQQEAFAIGDRLALLHDGQIIQIGTPQELYSMPVSSWVARFFGLTNILSGVVESSSPFTVRTANGLFSPGCQSKLEQPGSRVALLIRPTAVSDAENRSPINSLQGEIIDSVFRGNDHLIRIILEDGTQLEFSSSSTQNLGNRQIWNVDPAGILCIDEME